MINKAKLRKRGLVRQGRIVEWYRTKGSALQDARIRRMPVVEVEQPRGMPPLYGFNKGDRAYYVVASAPKTLIAGLLRGGIKARIIKGGNRK
jgi:hypothetical protein